MSFREETTIKSHHKQKFVEAYGHLPREFLPHSFTKPKPGEKWSVRKWLDHFQTLFPRAEIPEKLILRPGLQFQPPRFLFGWSMDRVTFFEMAGRLGFSYFDPKTDVSRSVIPWLDMTPLLNKILRQEFGEIMDLLGWVNVAPICLSNGRLAYCLALADSFSTGNEKPSDEHIETLRAYFGIGEGSTIALADNQPLWWLDYDCRFWRYKDSSCYNAENRPWMKKPRRHIQ
ncbi:hypothetical protein DFP72DRAFT_572363 [Ephemerocybe angulata]|uniref:Uncharacterized protein n=1 Tax=Ephemerocybe angulata TaxID=980116 RepID=A0A8H6HLN4_9AGAR|nr:hypothetical protein DFP72DRAFT_572363 [Tulosesus angulatus]